MKNSNTPNWGYEKFNNDFIIKAVPNNFRPLWPNNRLLQKNPLALMKNTAQKCWNSDPTKRPTASELKQTLNSVNSNPNLQKQISSNSNLPTSNLLYDSLPRSSYSIYTKISRNKLKPAQKNNKFKFFNQTSNLNAKAMLPTDKRRNLLKT